MKRRTVALLVVGAQFVGVAAKFASFAFLARLGNIEVAGTYTAILAVVTPIFLLSGMSLRNVYLTMGTVRFKSLLLLRLTYMVAGSVVVLVVAAAVYSHWFVLFGWMIFYKCSESLLDLLIAYEQKRDSLGKMALQSFVFAVATNASLCLSFAVTADLTSAMFSSACSGLLVVLIMSLSLLRGAWVRKGNSIWAARRSVAVWGRASRAGLLLSLASSAVALSTSLPIIVLARVASPTAVGLYSGIYYVSSVSNILYTSVSQVELHTFVRLARDGNLVGVRRHGRRVALRLSLVGAAGCLAILLAGVKIFSAVFGTDFSPEKFALIAMGLFIVVSPWGFVLDVQITALQGYGLQAIVASVNLGATIILALVPVPRVPHRVHS